MDFICKEWKPFNKVPVPVMNRDGDVVGNIQVHKRLNQAIHVGAWGERFLEAESLQLDIEW